MQRPAAGEERESLSLSPFFTPQGDSSKSHRTSLDQPEELLYMSWMIYISKAALYQ